jgi:hypothetical protein
LFDPFGARCVLDASGWCRNFTQRIAPDISLQMCTRCYCWPEAAFDPTEFTTAIKKEKTYVAACNFWWVNHLWSPTPGVPLNPKRVQAFAEMLFPNGPRHLSFMVHVAVDSSEDDVLSRKGSLLRVSPEELLHSVIFKVAERIDDNADDEELGSYRRVMLSVCFKFELCGAEDYYWCAYNLRQIYGTSVGDVVQRTAAQSAIELQFFKERIEQEKGSTITQKELQVLYTEKANTAKSNKDAISDGWLRDCQNVYERLLVDPACLKCLDKLEDKFGLASCLNSIAKLKIIVERLESM